MDYVETFVDDVEKALGAPDAVDDDGEKEVRRHALAKATRLRWPCFRVQNVQHQNFHP